MGFADSDVVDSGNFAVVSAVHSGNTGPLGYSDTVAAAIVSAVVLVISGSPADCFDSKLIIVFASITFN